MDSRFLSSAALGLTLLALDSSATAGLTCDRKLDEIQIRQFTTTDGLPLDAVYALAQDQAGFLWVGTEDGLARFDGTAVTPIDLDDHLDGAPAFAESLLAHDSGDMLAGITSSGLLRFEASRPDQVRMIHAVDSPIHAIGQLDDQVFLGARGEDLLIFGSSDDAVTKPAALSSGRATIKTMTPRSRGGLWLGYEGEGVEWFDEGEFQPLAISGLQTAFVDALLEDQEERLWIGTRQGLLRADPAMLPEQEPERLLDADFHVTALYAGSGGSLWIGTGNRGLLRYCNGLIQALDTASGLGRTMITDLIEDHEGSLWVATGGSGIFQLLDGPAHAITPANGLPDFPVLPILQAADGAMWLGTFGGGLVRIEDDLVQRIGVDKGLADEQVLSLAASGNRGVWAGTRTGVYRVDIDNGEFLARNPVPAVDQSVISLLSEPDGVWLGLIEGLVRLRSGDDGHYRIRHFSAPDGLFGGFILSLLRDRRGTLWVGTDGGGLYRLDDETLTATSLDGRLPSRVVLNLHESSDGILWLATNRGVVRADGDDVHVFGTRHGLPEAHVFSILDDHQGFLWFSGNRGVFRIAASDFEAVADGRQERLQALTFDISDGMPRTETNGGFQPPAWRRSNGQLWYPTIDGVAVFHPERVQSTLSAPTVLIDSVRAAARLESSQRVVQMEPRPPWIEFRYASPNFVRPQHVNYRYRLQGYEAGWYATRDRNAIYRSLGPGSYQFQVQSRQAGGPWSEVTSRQLIIERHWLEQPLLRLAVLVTVLALAAWIVIALVRARRVRWEQAAQQQKLEAVGLMAGGIAHDFNNVLTRIFHGAEQLADQLPANSTTRKDAEAILGAAEGGAALTRQLLSFARRQAIEPVWVDLSAQLLIIKSFVERMLPKSVSVSWHIDDGVGHCLIDPVQLQQVVLNLCINSSDAMNGSGDIVVRLQRAQEKNPFKSRGQRTLCAVLSVADTGPGMDESVRQRIFEPFFTTKTQDQGTGLGLAVTHAIVREADGWITVESTPGMGSTFHVCLPIEIDRDRPRTDSEDF